MERLPTYFISHGGGPWPWLDGVQRRMHDTLEASLKDMPRQLGVDPKAVLAVSGHWEEPEFTVMSTAHPSMLYDYRGFPRRGLPPWLCASMSF
jgi:aromatic ring-opening dioxygenase catalytic subunit (LigB family)